MTSPPQSPRPGTPSGPLVKSATRRPEYRSRARHSVGSGRAALAGAALVVVAAGLWARTGLAGVPGDAAGGILYAALLYLLLACAAPRARCAAVAAAAVVLCGGIELFQLTPWPARWAELWPPLRLVFGTTFNPWDLPAYAAGAVAAGLVDRTLRRPPRGPALKEGSPRGRPPRVRA